MKCYEKDIKKDCNTNIYTGFDSRNHRVCTGGIDTRSGKPDS